MLRESSSVTSHCVHGLRRRKLTCVFAMTVASISLTVYLFLSLQSPRYRLKAGTSTPVSRASTKFLGHARPDYQSFLLTDSILFISNWTDRKAAHETAVELAQSAVGKDPEVRAQLKEDRYYCQDHFIYSEEVFKSNKTTDFRDWSFNAKHFCPQLSLKRETARRAKFILSCKNGYPRLRAEMTSSSHDVMSVPFNHPCLKMYLQTCCRGEKLVPNVVHYVWIGSRKLDFFHFVSFMSVLRFMKPCLFLFHGTLPNGEFWDYFISLTPNVILVNRTIPDEIHGQKLKFVEHSADIMRIEALMAFGGYYMDWDEILLRSVEDLRDYSCTMSHALPNYLTIGFIMAEMYSTFLSIWYRRYRDYRPDWAYNSLQVPYFISQKYPDTVHIAGYRFVRPSVLERNKIFQGNYNWSENYGIHLYIRYYNEPTDFAIIRTLNTTIGAVCRHVLFGDKELCIN